MLSARALECVRGERRLFSSLNFELPARTLLEVRGTNGSGKTSLLRILCGLLAPAMGNIAWKGADIRGSREDFTAQLVYIGHLNAVKDHMSALENLSHASRIAGLPADDAAADIALRKFGLGDFMRLPCKALSQGQRRRVALARLALSSGYPLWLLDEPFTALDAHALTITRELIESHLSGGGMVVLTTHQDVPISAPITRRIELCAPINQRIELGAYSATATGSSPLDVPQLSDLPSPSIPVPEGKGIYPSLLPPLAGEGWDGGDCSHPLPSPPPRCAQGREQKMCRSEGEGSTKHPGLLETMRCVAHRDLLSALRRRADVLTTLIFFVIVSSLFPLGVGSDAAILRTIGPGVVWVAALLASMLALNRLFAHDHADGTLEQLILAPQPLTVLVLSKVAAHWLISGLPLVLIAPLLGLQYQLPAGALSILLASLLLGTPTLSLIGAIGGALTLGLRGGGALLSLLVLPLYIPVLIFGAGAVEAGMAGLDAAAHLSLLGALLLVALVSAPWATAMALRIAIE